MKIIKVHFSIIWILGDRVQVQQMLLAAGAGCWLLLLVLVSTFCQNFSGEICQIKGISDNTMPPSGAWSPARPRVIVLLNVVDIGADDN